MSGRARVGLLMPTFGAQAEQRRIFEIAREAEDFGFHSLWVRDHLFIPAGKVHGGITENGVHLEPLHVLGAIASVTRSVRLGTAILTPTRHPLRLAQDLATLSFLHGERFILGVGAGAFVEEFAALGLDWEQRRRMVAETVEVLRLTANGRPASYGGEVYRFEDVAILPPPPRVPLWYGGSGSPASVRIAVEGGFDGWIGLTPADIFGERIARLRELGSRAGRTLTVASIPPTSVAPTRSAALAPLDQEKIVASARSGGQRPDYRSFDEVKSALIVGSPAEAADQLIALTERGVDEIILDLRVVGPAFDDVFRLIGEDVLPRLPSR